MQAIAARLAEVLGGDLVLAGELVPLRNRQDWSGLEPVLPLAVVRPRTTAEVARTLALCHEARVPVVPQGGLTGLCGGAHPRPDGIVLSLERMSGVEAVDAATATMTVLAGTPLETVQRAAEAHGLCCPLDLGARGSAAIGGNIATNAGGNRVIRYGMTREMVLGLEVVLPDGTVLPMLNRLVKNNTGYDLKQLFIGAEGTLGVITRAVLRLQALPRCATAAFCGLGSFDAVVRLLAEARGGLGGLLSAFEVMWPDFYDLMTTRASGVRPPLAGRHARYVLLEAQGGDATYDLPRFEAFLERMLEAGILEDAAVAQSQADVKAFWAIRDAVAEFSQILGRQAGFDVSLPTAAMDEFVATSRAALEARFPDIVTLYFGHLGDGNIHLVWSLPGAGALPKAAVEAIVYGLVRERGGSISAEHGIGTARLGYLAYSRSPAELALMRTLKRTLDPHGIMNPGRVIEA